MSDCMYKTQGAVYDLKHTSGEIGSKCIVVSSNRHQSKIDTVVICYIKEKPDQDKFEDTGYHISFTCTIGGRDYPMIILTESIFTVKANRLTNYRFTVSDEIMSKIKSNLMNIMFGQDLYTLQEASLEILTNKLNSSSNEPVEETYVIEDEDLSVEEKQAIYAHRYKEVEVQNEKSIESVPNIEPIVKTSDEILQDALDRAEEIKNAIVGKRGYTYIYDRYEDFILEYYTEPKEKFLHKWGITSKELPPRLTRCKQLAVKNGLGKFWREFGIDKRKVKS